SCAHAALFVIETPTLAWLIVGVASGIVFHEAGHALCAICTGHTIQRLVIGIGPLLLRVRFKNAKLELRAMPFGGYVNYRPGFPARKLTRAFIAVGGILGNLSLMGIIATFASLGMVARDAQAPLTTIVVAQYVLVVVSLLPYRLKTGFWIVESDGRKLLK